MRNYIFCLFLLIGICEVKAQKPTLTVDTYKTWPEVRDGGISNDGKFVFYQTHNIPIGKSTYVVMATQGSFKTKILTDDTPIFSEDSRFVVGKLTNDTLWVLNLYKSNFEKISGVDSYKLFSFKGHSYLIYLKKTKELIIKSFDNNSVDTYNDVHDYRLSPDGIKLLLKQITLNEAGNKERLNLIDLITKKRKEIYEGDGAGSFIFDDCSEQIAFSVDLNNSTDIWYYKVGTDKAVLKLKGALSDDNDSLKVVTGQYWQFSKDRKSIFFSYKQAKSSKKEIDDNLEIASYRDSYLSAYYYGKDLWGNDYLRPNEYLSILNINTKKTIKLLSGHQSVLYGSFEHETDNMFIVASSFGNNDGHWNPSLYISYYLCNTANGELKPIELNRENRLPEIKLSPRGKYVIYFDPKVKNYLCFNTKSGIKNVVTQNVDENWTRFDLQDYPLKENMIVGSSGWVGDDDAVLINGSNDIWCIDPLNVKKPINLTKGEGKKNNIIFYPVAEAQKHRPKLGQKLLLSAFDLKNKDYGFYEVVLSANSYLKKKFMGPVFSGHIENGYTQLSGSDLICSKGSNSYIIRLEKVNKAPNFFFTQDFINYKPLSDLQPQQEYNWMTSELHTYKDSLGTLYQGVLYKPENFDSTKSYPVAFTYYLLKSNLLNHFPSVELAPADFTISLLVSNGYLVFLPDIYSRSKYSGDGALASLNAAADHLSNYKWVNSNKMAIAGSSFGGFETNYIVTHTSRFAAAVTGAGISDMISFASGVWGWGLEQQSFAQYTGLKMEVSLTENPQTYTRNSPILFANRVETPLLLMHNTKDMSVPYTQTRAFFTVLRTIGKKVWWLNYKQEGHSISGDENSRDYNIRVQQFLDHYLKDRPAPEWMIDHL